MRQQLKRTRTLRESVTDAKEWGVRQDVEASVYKNNPSLRIGFVSTGLTKAEAEKLAKEKNSERLNAGGVFYSVAKTEEDSMREYYDRSAFKQVASILKEHRGDDLELPSEVVINIHDLLSADDLEGVKYYEDLILDDVIGDWLSDKYGFLLYGFASHIIGEDVIVTDIEWDVTESFKKEGVSLNEATGNFGTSDIINLCSMPYDADDFGDYADEVLEYEPELDEDEVRERIYDLIHLYQQDDYEQVVALLKRHDVENLVRVKSGYYEGYYVEFKFDDAQELVWEITYRNEYRDDAKEALLDSLTKIERALLEAVEERILVEYSIAYRFSNGETGYKVEKDKKVVIENIKTAIEKLRQDGLKLIEKDIDLLD